VRLVDGYQTKLTGLTAAEVQTLFFAHPPQLLAALGLGPAAEAARLKLQAALPAASREQAERASRSILIDPRGWQESQSLASLPVLLDALWRMRWARYRGWRLQEEHEEGSRVRIRVRFDAQEEALQFALSFGADAEVIEPAELRGKVLEAARATAGRYASHASQAVQVAVGLPDESCELGAPNLVTPVGQPAR